MCALCLRLQEKRATKRSSVTFDGQYFVFFFSMRFNNDSDLLRDAATVVFFTTPASERLCFSNTSMRRGRVGNSSGCVRDWFGEGVT